MRAGAADKVYILSGDTGIYAKGRYAHWGQVV